MPTPKRTKTPSNLWQSIKPNRCQKQFEIDVIQFHYQHRTPIRYLPHVLGKKINLHQLYTSVIKRGGYKKVNERESWEEILGDLNLPKEGTNCELAIQSVYHRYLEDYERNQWNCLGSGSLSIDYSGSPINNNDINLTKHSNYISELGFRDRSVLASFVFENTPKIYCDYQHIVNNGTRSELGLSCDLKDEAELRHLTMSLKSGLINEIDFALNTLLILSNSGRISIDLRFTGDLLDLVVVTAGIVDKRPGCFYDQFSECQWMKEGLQFWNNTVEDGLGRIFLVPNVFSCFKSELSDIQRQCSHSDSDSSTSSTGSIFDDNHGSLHHRLVNASCHRAHLVVTILHNLVVGPHHPSSCINPQLVAGHWPSLRLLLLAAHSKDSVLRRLSLQTLARLRFVLRPVQEQSGVGNGAGEEWFTGFLLDFLMELLASEDRADRIVAYEMLQSLCLTEDNHETLSQHLQSPFLSLITSHLLVPDIHPLCCALEALLALSQLGDDMCRRMALYHPLLHSLLQFINIEAQMFGPSAVYKIKTYNGRPPPVQGNNYNNQHSLSQMVRFQGPRGPPPPMGTALVVRAPIHHVPPPTPVTAITVNNTTPQSTHHSLSHLPSPTTQLPQLQPPPLSLSQSPSALYINHHQQQLQHQYQQHNPHININTAVNGNAELTPLQQIDHLLTKSIASFSTPIPAPQPTSTPPNKIGDHVQRHEENNGTSGDQRKSCTSTIISTNSSSPSSRRQVKIKCCVEGVDLDIEDMNGLMPSRPSNGDSKAGEEAEHEDHLHHNGVVVVTSTATATAMDAHESPKEDDSEEDDPDRRQMPPPSLPPPSVLKKMQMMRPSGSGGGASHSPRMTNGGGGGGGGKETAGGEQRLEQVRAWLRRSYRVCEDSGVSVAKLGLLEDMHEALAAADNDDARTGIPAQDLHACIKEVFGPTVQVKVEHGANGDSHLIYSHLARIGDKAPIPNGVVSPIAEMNGFVHHGTASSVSKDAHSDSDDDDVDRGGDDGGDDDCGHKMDTSETVATAARSIGTVSASMKRELRRKRRSKTAWCMSKMRKTYRWNKPRPHRATAVVPAVETQCPVVAVAVAEVASKTSVQRPETPSTEEMRVPCLWGQCALRVADLSALHAHLNSAHMQAQRAPCQWRDCPSAHLLRAPLSLLSHVLQEHCAPSSAAPAALHPGFLASPLPAALHSTLQQAGAAPEKSGWSVLLDHHRSEEHLAAALPEGPITKHIRIASSLVLRNLARHSLLARHFLARHQRLLASVALAGHDCSAVIVQCLDHLAAAPPPPDAS